MIVSALSHPVLTSVPPLALYIHFPWCIQKCPYCDFNSYTLKTTLDEQQYIDVLLRDLDQMLPLLDKRPLVSIFMGGGTPSLFSGTSLDKLLSGVCTRFPKQDLQSIEVTLEANPGTFEQQRFKDYVHIGINRLSIGVQSFNDTALKCLGRIHDAKEAIQAVERAYQAGFNTINLDLMYGLPQQTLALAQADIEQAIKLSPQHISWYHLTMEPNTVFFKRPPAHLPPDSVLGEIEALGVQQLAEAGYHRYEVSAYSQPHQACQHNLNYWQFGDYVGIGAGAHSKITQLSSQTIMRAWKYRSPHKYLSATGALTANTQHLYATDLIFEFMLNALRLKQGVPIQLFTDSTGLSFSVIESRVQQAINDGLLVDDPKWLCTTPLGYRYLNDVVLRFEG